MELWALINPYILNVCPLGVIHRLTMGSLTNYTAINFGLGLLDANINERKIVKMVRQV